jgi:hypothetical protein
MILGVILAPLGFFLGTGIVIALGFMIPIWIFQLIRAWIS